MAGNKINLSPNRLLFLLDLQSLCLILSSVIAPVPTVLKNAPKGRNIFTKWHSCAAASHRVTTVCGFYKK